METRDLKQIIKILEQSDLEMIEFEQGGTKIKVKRFSQGGQVVAMPSAMPMASAGTVTTHAQEFTGTEVKSPLVGTYYSKPSPDAPAFAKVGDKVKAGQVLCIVEAMKVMNEIKAPVAGTVSAILLKDGQMVEFDQTIFVIE